MVMISSLGAWVLGEEVLLSWWLATNAGQARLDHGPQPSVPPFWQEC